MNCPGCGSAMASMTLDARMSPSVEIDLCRSCQAFWFDRYESLKLSPGSTLKLMKFIGENATSGKALVSDRFQCPRCDGRLKLTHDLQRSTRFSYWRCEKEHGKFIRFFEFLREKNFIRPLSPKQIEELRQHVQTVNCSNCGAPIDLVAASACSHCGSPVSMLDMNQPQELLKQLKQATEPDPVALQSLPFDLAMARRHVDISFQGLESSPQWWDDAASSGLVQAGLTAIARWLKKFEV